MQQMPSSVTLYHNLLVPSNTSLSLPGPDAYTVQAPTPSHGSPQPPSTILTDQQPGDGPVSLHSVERAPTGHGNTNMTSGKPTVYLQDDLIETSGHEQAVLPPGITRLGKKKFLRNDFLGSNYEEILNRVKSEMKNKALQDVHLTINDELDLAKRGSNSSIYHFNNNSEKMAAYKLL